MSVFETSLRILDELFSRDFQFALATAQQNIPSLRMVDTFYDNGAFWIVTNRKSRKVQDIQSNPQVALCSYLYSFSGKAFVAGHPLEQANKKIREKLVKAFAPWYFAHNNEEDEDMCYLCVKPTSGFFFKDGTGYKVDFEKQEAKTFPFEPDIVVVQ